MSIAKPAALPAGWNAEEFARVWAGWAFRPVELPQAAPQPLTRTLRENFRCAGRGGRRIMRSGRGS